MLGLPSLSVVFVIYTAVTAQGDSQVASIALSQKMH